MKKATFSKGFVLNNRKNSMFSCDIIVLDDLMLSRIIMQGSRFYGTDYS